MREPRGTLKWGICTTTIWAGGRGREVEQTGDHGLQLGLPTGVRGLGRHTDPARAAAGTVVAETSEAARCFECKVHTLHALVEAQAGELVTADAAVPDDDVVDVVVGGKGFEVVGIHADWR